MKIRQIPVVFLAVLVAACSGDTEQAAEASATPEMSADEMALNQLRDDWAVHYNLGHASVAAGYYADDAWSLTANVTSLEGRDAIEANMAATMEAVSPQISFSGGENMIFGDRAVAMGGYSLEATTPDGAVTSSGTYLVTFTKLEGEWKIQGGITNYDAEPAEGFAYGDMSDLPENEGTMGDLIASYETHWNLGHPSMVADLYADDAMVAFADQPTSEGREDIGSVLAERMEANPADLTINDVGTIDFGDGWALDGGWYQMDGKDGGDPLRVGMYLLLVNETDDGWQIKWMVTNGKPADAM
jgi:ketosteroid isomerase-like protein